MQIGLQRHRKLLFRDVGYFVRVNLESGVVDQDIETSELLDCFTHDLLACLAVAHVAGKKDAASAFGLNGCLCRGGVAVFGKIADCHVSAFAGEQDRNGPTNAGITTGDERNLARQFLRADVKGRIIEGSGIDVRFFAWFGQMLFGEGRFWIDAPTRLHRSMRFGRRALLLLLGVDLALDAALLVGGLYAGVVLFLSRHGSLLGFVDVCGQRHREVPVPKN